MSDHKEPTMVGENEVRQIIDQFNASNLSKLDWQFGDGRLVLERQPVAPQVNATPVVAAAVETVAAVQPTESKMEATIDAPLVGVVYLTPEPGKPEFVQPGDQVKAGDVVCIIESMKMMNEIRSDVNGTVKAILTQNEELVEFGQALIEIEEDTHA